MQKRLDEINLSILIIIGCSTSFYFLEKEHPYYYFAIVFLIIGLLSGIYLLLFKKKNT
jgi:hypothetical protein